MAKLKITAQGAQTGGFILLFVVVIFALYHFWEAISSFFTGGVAGEQQKSIEKNQKDSIASLPVNTSWFKHPDTAYQATAESIYTVLNHFQFESASSRGQKVLDALKVYNAEELKQVYKDFGLRVRSVFNLGGIVQSEATDMFDWFRQVLNDEVAIMKALRQMFKKSGLTF